MTYEARLLLTAIAALGVVGAVNYAADPFGISLAGYDSRPLERDSFDDNVRLAKAHIVSKLRPEAVVLGSSRAEIGISPAHPAWRYRHVYNLGLPHAGLHETGEYLEHAIAAGRLKQAVFGLDFFQFNPMLKPRPDFENMPASGSRLGLDADSFRRLRHSRALSVEVSDGVFDRAAMAQQPQESVYLRDGSRKRRSQRSFVRQAGSQHAGFLKSEREFFENIELAAGIRGVRSPVRGRGGSATSSRCFVSRIGMMSTCGCSFRRPTRATTRFAAICTSRTSSFAGSVTSC